MTVEYVLKDRVALVTGGAKRIGRAVCLELAAAGCNVVVHYSTSELEAVELCTELQRLGVTAWAVAADLANTAQASELLPRAVAAAGPVDVLINNASIFPEDTVLDFDAERLASCVTINAFSPLLLARAIAAQGRTGTVVNLLDARVQDYDHLHAAYHLSKRMLLSLTSMLALELAPRIRVNAVAPGLILPPEGKDEEYLRNLAHTNPLGMYGAPEDIAAAVLFLVRSPFVTGQVIYVDGGRHLKGRVYG